MPYALKNRRARTDRSVSMDAREKEKVALWLARQYAMSNESMRIARGSMQLDTAFVYSALPGGGSSVEMLRVGVDVRPPTPPSPNVMAAAGAAPRSRHAAAATEVALGSSIAPL